MAYATPADVQTRMPQFTLGTDTKPTLASVPDFIEDAENELNAVLATLGYLTPVVQATSPLSWPIVVAVSVQATIWRILDARAASVGGEASIKGADRAKQYYTERIEWLRDPKNPYELPDCPRSTDQVVKPASILQCIETPCIHEGENWPLSRQATLSQVF